MDGAGSGREARPPGATARVDAASAAGEMWEFARRAGQDHLIVEAMLDDFGSIRSIDVRAALKLLRLLAHPFPVPLPLLFHGGLVGIEFVIGQQGGKPLARVFVDGPQIAA